MKKMFFVLLLFLIPAITNACEIDSINYVPNIVFNEKYENVYEKISKVYKLHGYSGGIGILIEENFVGNTHIVIYRLMGHGFFKYNGILTKKGWITFTFKNNRLVSLETKVNSYLL